MLPGGVDPAGGRAEAQQSRQLAPMITFIAVHRDGYPFTLHAGRAPWSVLQDGTDPLAYTWGAMRRLLGGLVFDPAPAPRASLWGEASLSQFRHPATSLPPRPAPVGGSCCGLGWNRTSRKPLALLQTTRQQATC